MKLLFFIRAMEISSRSFGTERSRAVRRESHTTSEGETRDLHELVFCRAGAGVLRSADGAVPVQSGTLLFNPRGRLVKNAQKANAARDANAHTESAAQKANAARDASGHTESAAQEANAARDASARNAGDLSVVQILFAEELFSPSVNMDREALYVLGIVKLHAKKQNHLVLSRIGQERMNTLLDAMLWEYQNRYRGYSWALRLKLIELLITLMRDKQFHVSIRGLKPWSSSRIQDAVLYLNTDYMNPISVQDVLESCGLSRSHFHALFKQETGQTFVEYLSTLRCARAAELLLTTEKTVLEIATESGFNNLSHFYHVFRRKYRTSPVQYRTAQHTTDTHQTTPHEEVTQPRLPVEQISEPPDVWSSREGSHE